MIISKQNEQNLKLHCKDPSMLAAKEEFLNVCV